MENRNQKQRKVTANGFKPFSAVVTFGIMLLMVFLAAFAFKSCSVSNHTETANQAVMDEETKAQMEQELLAIADSLDAMDGSVTENLTELSGFNQSTIERVESLESTISKVREVINNYLETDTSKREDVTNGLTTISEELLTVQESLTGTKDKLLSLLGEMETADSKRAKEIEGEFVKVAELLDNSKNQLSMTYENLVGMIDILRVENSDSTKEVLTILEEVEKELSLTFFEKVADLSEEIKAGNASLESKMMADTESMTGQMSALSEQLNVTQSDLADILTKMEENTTENQTENMKQFSEIQKEVADFEKDFRAAHTALNRTLSDMDHKNEKQMKEEFSKVADSFADSKETLTKSYESLVTILDSMKAEEDKNTKELVTLVETAEGNLHTLIFDTTTSLEAAIREGNVALGNKITEDVNALQGRLSDLSTQIHTTQSDIAGLLSMTSENEAANQEEIKAQFADIKDRIATFKADFEAAHEELKGILSEMSAKAQENHEELLSTLSKMDADMSKASEESLSKITDTLASLEETYISELSQFESSMNQSFTDVNNGITSLSNDMVNNISNMESNISGDLSEMTANLREDVANMNQNITTNLEDIQSSITNQYMDVTNIVNQMDSGIMDYIKAGFMNLESQMQSVFQSVSSGKSLLASALLTRGVNCASDATFQEIHDALLSIPQEIVVGVQELPGEIVYEYHYHQDGEGNIVHEGTSAVPGGCYASTKHMDYEVVGSHVEQRTGTKQVAGSCGCGNTSYDYGYDPCPSCRHHHWGNTCNASVNKTVTYKYDVKVDDYGWVEKDYYDLICSLADGQIIGAHISYVQGSKITEPQVVDMTPYVLPREEILNEEVIEVVEEIQEPITEAEIVEEKELLEEAIVEEALQEETVDCSAEDTISEEVASSDTAVDEPVEISNEEITE